MTNDHKHTREHHAEEMEEAVPAEPTKKQRHIASNFSSSLSGSRVGDGVAERRANLLHAQGEPRIGRREPAPPPDPRPQRILYFKGILAGAAVIAIVIIILVAIGANTTLQ